MFGVDDRLPFHRKLAIIPKRMKTRCMGLWLLSGCWAKGSLSGGFVPRGQIEILGGTKAEAEWLVTATFWECVEGGYQFHDWADWQETIEELEHKRERERVKKAAWRKRRAVQNVHSGHNGGPGLVSTGVSTIVSTTMSPACPRPVHRQSRGRARDPIPSPDPDQNSDHVAAALITANLPRETAESGGGGFSDLESDQTESGPESGPLTAELLDVLRERIPVPDGMATERAVRRLEGWLTLNHPGSQARVLESLVGAFSRDEWACANGWPLADLAKRPERYLNGKALLDAKQSEAHAALVAGDLDKWRSVQAEIQAIKASVIRANGGGHGPR